MSLSLSISVYVSLSISLSVYVCVWLSLYICVCVCLSLSLFVYVCVSFSFSLCACVCVRYLKLIPLYHALFHVLPDLMHHSQQGNVGLARAGGGTDQQVVVGVVGYRVYHSLDAVEGLAVAENGLSNLEGGG